MQHRPLSKVVFLLLAIAFGLALYLLHPFGLYFLNDDLVHIPLSSKGIFGQHNSVRFFNDLTLYVDSILFGKNPLGYHFNNLLIHAGTCIILFFIVRQLQLKKNVPSSPGFALFCSALFFCYPFHSESIFWIIGRGSSIGAFFLLLAVFLYGKKEKSFSAGIFSIIAFAFSLFTYESVWCFFIILIFISLNHLKVKPGAFLHELIWLGLWFVVFITFLLYRWNITGSFFGKYELDALHGNPVSGMLGNFARLLLRSFAPPMQNSSWFVSLAIVLIVLFIVGLRWTYKHYPRFRNWILALLTSYFISLIPYVSLGIDTHGTESERFLYLPSVFICLLLGTILSSIKKESLQVGWSSAVLCYFIVFLWQSSSNYRTASDIVRKTMAALKSADDKKFAVVQNVPGDYKGALMLRLGLREGWQWLKEKPLPDSIIIVSYSNNDRMFKTTLLTEDTLQHDVEFEHYFDANDNIIEGDFIIKTNKAVLINYDSSGLTVLK